MTLPHETRPDRLLSLWRRPGDRAPDRIEVRGLRALLNGHLALHQRGWRHAVAEAPVAVGFGIAFVARGALRGPAADLVFSAVLTHAADGNAAAALVLSHARARRRTAGRRRARG